MTNPIKAAGYAAAALATSLFLAGAPAEAQQKTLRVVPDGDLRVLDPIFTTAGTTASHGYMVYDVLFTEDGKFQPQPQMVESWTKSPDELTWTFRLRTGLTFHDGSPVRADDAVASLKRWGAKIVGLTALAARPPMATRAGRWSRSTGSSGTTSPMPRPRRRR